MAVADKDDVSISPLVIYINNLEMPIILYAIQTDELGRGPLICYLSDAPVALIYASILVFMILLICYISEGVTDCTVTAIIKSTK